MSHLPVDPLVDNPNRYGSCDDWGKAIGNKIAEIVGFFLVLCIIGGIVAGIGAAMGSAKRSIPKHIPHVKVEIGEKSYETPEH